MSESPARSRLAVLLFTDIVGSTVLKSQLGAITYTRFLARHNRLFESLCAQFTDSDIFKHTGDGYFAAFTTATDAVDFALRFQHALRNEDWSGTPLTSRIGIHIGEVAVIEMAGKSDVVGLAADLAARVMSLAQGGQILLTREAFNNARQFVSDPSLRWLAHGPYLFKGSDEPLDVFEVGAAGLAPLTPPRDVEKARRVVPHDQEQTLGWRPALGLEVPGRLGWVLQRQLGEGGFGEVWLAQHVRTRDRRAFKFCFDAERLRSLKRELTLFRLMRETLGDRDDIARLHEVRLDEPPYFLESEYTEGGNLSEWAGQQRGIGNVPLETRLEIVAKVADAVAAAHSVGILHKDIKPSNVLIHESPIPAGEDRAEGSNRKPGIQPRLSDFGIGLLSDRRQLEARNITAMGMTVLTEDASTYTGTRMYAPPEMLAGYPFTIQGDVYALGVLLYQLVVGDFERPLAQGWEREIGDDLLREDIAACVDGDPKRRLASAGELEQRLRSLDERREQRRRDHIAADRARRRRAQLRFAGAAAVVLVLLSLGLSMGFFRERTLRVQLAAQKAEAEKQKAEADRRREEAEAVNSFLTEDMLSKAGPDHLPDKAIRDAIIQKLIDPAADAVGERFKDKPLIEAAVRCSLAPTYRAVGRADLGVPHATIALQIHQRLLGNDHLDTLNSINNLGYLLEAQGKFDGAEPLFREALERRRRVLGDDHPDTLTSINNMGYLLQAQGKLDQAEPLLREGLERSRRVLGDDNPETLTSISNMGTLLRGQGKLDQAEPLYREAMERRRRLQGDDHPMTLITINNMGDLLQAQGKLDEAEPLFREVLERRRRVLGDDHPNTLTSINNMGYLLREQDKLDQAEPLLREALERSRRVLGDDHPDTLNSISNMGTLLQKQDKLDQAEPLFREALERYRRALGDDHPSTLGSINNMAILLLVQGKLDQAEPLLRDALERHRRVLGNDHSWTLTSINNMGYLLGEQGKLDEAQVLYREVLERRRRVLGDEHTQTLESIINLGALLRDQGKLDEAELLFREALTKANAKPSLGPKHARTKRIATAHAKCLDAVGRHDDAAAVRKQFDLPEPSTLAATRPSTAPTTGSHR